MLIGLIIILLLLTPNGAAPGSQVQINSLYFSGESKQNVCPENSYYHPVEAKCVFCECVLDHPEYYENNCANIVSQCRREDQYLNEETGGCSDCSEICSVDSHTYNKRQCEQLCPRDRCCADTEFYSPHNGTCDKCSTICGVDDNQTFCNVNCPGYNLKYSHTSPVNDSESSERRQTTEGVLNFSHFESLPDQPGISATTNKTNGNNFWPVWTIIGTVSFAVLVVFLIVLILFRRYIFNLCSRDEADPEQDLNVGEPLLSGSQSAAPRADSRDAADRKDSRASVSIAIENSKSGNIRAPLLADMLNLSPGDPLDSSPAYTQDTSQGDLLCPPPVINQDQSHSNLLNSSSLNIHYPFTKNTGYTSPEDTQYQSTVNEKDRASSANIMNPSPEDIENKSPADANDAETNNLSTGDVDPSSVHVGDPISDDIRDSCAGDPSATAEKYSIIGDAGENDIENKDDHSRGHRAISAAAGRQELISGDVKDTKIDNSSNPTNKLPRGYNSIRRNRIDPIVGVSNDLVNADREGLFTQDTNRSCSDHHEHIELRLLKYKDENTSLSQQEQSIVQCNDSENTITMSVSPPEDNVQTTLKQLDDLSEYIERNVDLSLREDSSIVELQQNNSQGIQVASDGSQIQSLVEPNSGSLTTPFGIQETNLDNSDPIVKDKPYSS